MVGGASDVDVEVDDVEIEEGSILDSGSLSGTTVNRFFGSRNNVRSTSICRFSRSRLLLLLLVGAVDDVLIFAVVELLINNGAFCIAAN